MSHYKFAPGSRPSTYIFPTDRGWFYTVSFPNQSATFDGHPILQNSGLFFEIVFERSLLGKREKGGDPLVEATILTIISQHLQGQGVLPIYDLQMPEGDLAYAGLLTHADHPNCVEIPDAFQHFLEQDLATGKLVFRR